MKKNSPLAAVLIPLLAAAASAQSEQPRGDAEIFAPLRAIAGMPGTMLQETPRGDAEIVSTARSAQVKADAQMLVVQAQEQIGKASALVNASRRAIERTKTMIAEVAKAAGVVAAQADALVDQLSVATNSGRLSFAEKIAADALAGIEKAEAAAKASEVDAKELAQSNYDYELMMNRRFSNHEAGQADAELAVARANLERAVIEMRALGVKLTRYLHARAVLDSGRIIQQDYANALAMRKTSWDRVADQAKIHGAEQTQIFNAAPTN